MTMSGARRRRRAGGWTRRARSWGSSSSAPTGTARRSRPPVSGTGSSARCRSARATSRFPVRLLRSRLPAMAQSPFSLDGKTAIVTGGGTGIGKSIAIEFARAGADVALCSRKAEHLEPVVKEIQKLGKRSYAMVVDVRQEEQVKAMVEKAVADWGRLDVMVN